MKHGLIVSVALLVMVAAFVAVSATTTNSCQCIGDYGFSIVGTHSRSAGISMPTLFIAGIPITGSVGFTVDLDTRVAVVQQCSCRSYCCPDEKCVHPTGYATVETEEYVSDPLIPNRSRLVKRNTMIVLSSPNKVEWKWIQGPNKNGNPPPACKGEKTLYYTVANGSMSFDYGIGVAGVNYVKSIDLVSTRTTFYGNASGCRCGEKKEIPPKFIAVPKQVYLPEHGECQFTVTAYDANGVGDIKDIVVENLPRGISAEISGITDIELKGGGYAKQATVTVTWAGATDKENKIGILVEDKAGEFSLAVVTVVSVLPPKITFESPIYYNSDMYLMRLKVTNPNSEQLDIGLRAVLSPDNAGSLRFGLGQGSQSIVVSPRAGGSQEVGLAFYPAPNKHCRITITVESSTIKYGIVTKQWLAFSTAVPPQ